MFTLDRNLCAYHFLTRILTSKERLLVASFALGYSQVEIARACDISEAAVSKMTKRVLQKATLYWQV